MSPNNEDEQAPIHLAAIHGRVDIVEELLMRESHSIMNEDEDSNTPLHLACMNKKAKTTEVRFRHSKFFKVCLFIDWWVHLSQLNLGP